MIQLILFTVKWTNIFMPSDLWNTYSFYVMGLYAVCGDKNAWLSMGLMILMNLYVLLFADIGALFFLLLQLPGWPLTAPHHVEGVPFYVIVNFLMNKLGLNKSEHKSEYSAETIGTFWGTYGIRVVYRFYFGLYRKCT